MGAPTVDNTERRTIVKAVVIKGKGDLAIEDREEPTPGEGQVRVRIRYMGICGSDIHYYFNGANGEFVIREPLIPGHEVSGVVDLDPSGTFAPGTPVTVHPQRFGKPVEGLEDWPHLWPGGDALGSASTWPHTQGGGQEYLVVDASQIRVLPENLPVRRAALSEPLSVALHAITRAGDLTGKHVLVNGAGPIGLLAAAAAHILEAASVAVSDVLPEPLERATRLGATHTYCIPQEPLPDSAFDVVLECSGVPVAVGPVLRAARMLGIIVQVGMLPNKEFPMNFAPLVSKELDYRGTFRFFDEIDTAVQMLADNPVIEDVITHEFAADDAEEAFAVARDSKKSGKVLVSF